MKKVLICSICSMLIACVAATMLCSCNNSAQAQQAQEPTTTQQQQQPTVVVDPVEKLFNKKVKDYSSLSEEERKSLERVREIHSDKESFILPDNGKIVEAAKIVINDQRVVTLIKYSYPKDNTEVQAFALLEKEFNMMSPENIQATIIDGCCCIKYAGCFPVYKCQPQQQSQPPQKNADCGCDNDNQKQQPKKLLDDPADGKTLLTKTGGSHLF